MVVIKSRERSHNLINRSGMLFLRDELMALTLQTQTLFRMPHKIRIRTWIDLFYFIILWVYWCDCIKITRKKSLFNCTYFLLRSMLHTTYVI